MEEILELERTAGPHIRTVCEKAAALAEQSGKAVHFEFNETHVTAQPGETAEALQTRWANERDAAYQARMPSITSVTSVKMPKRDDLPRKKRLPAQAPAKDPVHAPPAPVTQKQTAQDSVQAPPAPVAQKQTAQDSVQAPPALVAQKQTAQDSVQAPPALVAQKQKSKPASALTKSVPDIPGAMKSWLAQWWEPQDPRFSPRESLPWIIAYFFNGGAPEPNSVRDISLDGMFLCTTERWYLGTIIRVTLSDRRLPSAERSIALNAMAVRSDENGVGLCFIFQEEKPRKQKQRRGAPPPPEENGLLVNVTRNQLKEFLERLKSSVPPAVDAQNGGAPASEP